MVRRGREEVEKAEEFKQNVNEMVDEVRQKTNHLREWERFVER